VLTLLLGTALASGTQSLQTAQIYIDHQARLAHASVLYGARTSSAKTMYYRWKGLGRPPNFIDVILKAEGEESDIFRYRLAPQARVSAGDLRPQNQSGDTEPGWVSLRAGADGRAYFHDFELMVAPELRWDEGEAGEAYAALPLGWVGFHTRRWRVGFGLEDRWFGPGRFGGLMLTNNASPAPLASAATEHAVGQGRFRLEAGAGWLNQPRSDVENPGWLVFDFRFSPFPALEIGATRMALFGGKGRPSPEFGQLLLPTRPHVANDPNQRLPDQDEIAALDARLSFPLDTWVPNLGVAYLDLWTQYGGEDVIARQIGPVKVPALAGIANLWGAELGGGAWAVCVEWARLLDDQFRWYSGHRVYHDGFSQSGMSMGHPSGGDSRTWSASVRWMPDDIGAEIFASDRRRVGVVAPADGQIFTLMRDERAQSAGLRGWFSHLDQQWNAGVSVSKVRDVQFKPDVDALHWRFFIGI